MGEEPMEVEMELDEDEKNTDSPSGIPLPPSAVVPPSSATTTTGFSGFPTTTGTGNSTTLIKTEPMGAEMEMVMSTATAGQSLPNGSTPTEQIIKAEGPPEPKRQLTTAEVMEKLGAIPPSKADFSTSGISFEPMPMMVNTPAPTMAVPSPPAPVYNIQVPETTGGMPFLEQTGNVLVGPGAEKEAQLLGLGLPKLNFRQHDDLARGKKYCMEQSIKHVLMKQTVAHQHQQQKVAMYAQALSLMARVYIGSISFELREESIKNSFSPFGPIKSINMSWDPVTGHHKGFAFLEYDVPEAALLAAEQMNGLLLGGRNIKVVGRPSNMPQATPIIDMIQEEAKQYHRVYVASVHQDLNETDVRSVFEAFGKVTVCQLAKTIVGTHTASNIHRGYGYLEYDNEQSAMDAVSSMNLFDLGGQYLRVVRAITPPQAQSYIVQTQAINLPTAAAVAAAAVTAKIQAMEATNVGGNIATGGVGTAPPVVVGISPEDIVASAHISGAVFSVPAPGIAHVSSLGASSPVQIPPSGGSSPHTAAVPPPSVIQPKLSSIPGSSPSQNRVLATNSPSRLGTPPVGTVVIPPPGVVEIPGLKPAVPVSTSISNFPTQPIPPPPPPSQKPKSNKPKPKPKPSGHGGGGDTSMALVTADHFDTPEQKEKKKKPKPKKKKKEADAKADIGKVMDVSAQAMHTATTAQKLLDSGALSEKQKKMIETEAGSSIAAQENLQIKGNEARNILMHKLMRKVESCVLVLKNMVDSCDVDEFLEEEIEEECGKFGQVDQVVIYQEKQGEGDDAPVIVKIFVRFSLPQEAETAKNSLDKRFFGGRQITADIYDQNLFNHNELTG